MLTTEGTGIKQTEKLYITCSSTAAQDSNPGSLYQESEALANALYDNDVRM